MYIFFLNEETYFLKFADQSMGKSLVSQPAAHQHDQCSACHQLDGEKKERQRGCNRET